MKSFRSLVSSDIKRKSVAIRPGSRFLTSSIPIADEARVESLNMKREPEDAMEDEQETLEHGLASESRSTEGSYSSATRVRSHSRSLRAMANPSAVWAHFDLCSNDPLRAECRICGAVVVRGGANPRQCGTTNLHRHLRVHHGGRLIGKAYHVMRFSDGSFEAREASEASSGKDSSARKVFRAGASLLRQGHSVEPSQRASKLVLKQLPLHVNLASPSSSKAPLVQQSQNATPETNVATHHQLSPEVCLRWNSYHSNMQTSFPNLLDNEQFVDVTLACEGRSLKCHKMILSSCSDYLASLLRENPCQHPIILMKDLKFWEIEALVKFMYRGEVNVAQDKLPQLLMAAEALQVKGLAGPSHSPTPKPPMLIPQTRKPATQTNAQDVNHTKNKPLILSKSSAFSFASSKSSQKRPLSPQQEDHKPVVKIKLQQRVSPSIDNSSIVVKEEPVDESCSPIDQSSINDDTMEEASNLSNFGQTLSINEEANDEEIQSGDNSDFENEDTDNENSQGFVDSSDADEEIEYRVDRQLVFTPTQLLEQEEAETADERREENKKNNKAIKLGKT